jgi:hypothetical protein
MLGLIGTQLPEKYEQDFRTLKLSLYFLGGCIPIKPQLSYIGTAHTGMQRPFKTTIVFLCVHSLKVYCD